jgi:hypothetical protein
MEGRERYVLLVEKSHGGAIGATISFAVEVAIDIFYLRDLTVAMI